MPIIIDEVIIQAESKYNYFPSYNSFELSKTIAQQQSLTNIGTALQNYTPANIQFYGLSNASISVRGANDDHTVVLWNGVPINSLSLGSMDISLISNTASNSVQLITNAGSNNFTAGSFGGVLLLDNQFKDTITATTIIASLGSFNHYKVQASQIIAKRKYIHNINAFYEQAQNNFPYVNRYAYNQPTDTVKHNQLQQYGLVQDMQIKFHQKHTMLLGTWIQNKYKQIPNTMAVIKPSQKYQQDFTVKNYIQFKGDINTQLKYQLITAHLYDYQLYEDKDLKIDTSFNLQANYKTNRWYNNVLFNYQLNNQTNFDVGFQFNYLHTNIDAYETKRKRMNSSLFLAWNYHFSKLKIQASVRQEIQKGKYILPLWSVSINYFSKNYMIGISYADKYHADFNDLYWAVGGNENLKAERGFTLNYFNSCKKEWTHQLLQIKNSIYYNRINNNIIWLPYNTTIWTPMNIQQTHYYGNEFSVLLQNKFSASKINIWLNYNFNQSIILKNEISPEYNKNYIPYKPMHTLKSDINYQTKNFTIGWNVLFNSQRFTTTSNDDFLALPKYTLHNLYLQYEYNFKQSALAFQINVNNITNKDYESVRNYAQPKRNLNISITYKINKNEEK
ncbi:MAG: TonB-dependent receptor plug domain-containing protein [Chitinophagales bacterium]